MTEILFARKSDVDFLLGVVGGGLTGGNDTQVIFNDNGVLAGDAGFTFDKTTDILSINGGVRPQTNNVGALGSATLGFSGLFLGSGASINFNNSDVVITHSTNTLAFTGATTYSFDASVTITGAVSGIILYDRTTGATDAWAIYAASGVGRLFAFNGSVDRITWTKTDWSPVSNDIASLGTSTKQWADLFLATGGVINFNAGESTVTHAAGQLQVDGTQNGFNFRVGSPTGASGIFKQITLLGSDNGSGAGTFIQSDLGAGTSLAWALGNRSAILGGTFSRQTLLVSRDGLDFGIGEPGVSHNTYMTLSTTALTPFANDGLTLGTATLMWGDLFIAPLGTINFNNGDVLITHAANELRFTGGSVGYTFDASVYPSTNDGGALGAALNGWSDLFLANGGVLNWNNSATTLTQSATGLTQLTTGAASHFILQNTDAGTQGGRFELFHNSASPAANDLIGEFRVTGRTSTAAQVTYNSVNFIIEDATNATITSKTQFAVRAAGGVKTFELVGSTASVGPDTNDALTLGTGTKAWGDLFLASGAVINFNNGAETITQSAGQIQTASTTNGFNFVHGTATSTSGVFRQITILGSDTGSGAGAFIQADLGNGTVLSWALGNRSSILGGTFNNNALLRGNTGIDLRVGSTDVVTISTTAFSPFTDATFGLGTSSLKWAGLYLSAGTAINWGNSYIYEDSSHFVYNSDNTTPATLSTNGDYTFTPTSNTNFRISYRGSDGVTRVGNITLA